MKRLFRAILVVILTPILAAVLFVLTVVGIIGLPLLWEELVARLVAPRPDRG